MYIGGGRGQGRNPSGGRGRGGGPYAAGPGGDCVCPKCGNRQQHQVGTPCNSITCSKCGTRMNRE